MTMPLPPPSLERLADALAPTGLVLRGAFHTDAAQDHGLAQGTVLLIGMVGREGWDRFASSSEAGDGQPDPMDRWSKRLIDAWARQWGGQAFYPSDGPPYIPFQRWAQRAEAVFPSPLGLLIHPLYGLSHSYRGAVLVPQRLEVQKPAAAENPCTACIEKPCLSACPVSAFSIAGYDVAACAAHLNSASQNCRAQGCLARAACPVGRDFAQAPAQIAFHMQAFYKARATPAISDRHKHPPAD